MKKREEKEPYWKRRIEGDVKRLRRDLGKIEAWFKGKWKNERKSEKEKLDRKYRLKAKGFHIVMEEIKQRVISKASKVKRYVRRVKQFQNNSLFSSNQGIFFKSVQGEKMRTASPNPEEATKFWSKFGELMLTIMIKQNGSVGLRRNSKKTTRRILTLHVRMLHTK